MSLNEYVLYLSKVRQDNKHVKTTRFFDKNDVENILSASKYSEDFKVHLRNNLNEYVGGWFCATCYDNCVCYAADTYMKQEYGM